MLDNIIKSLAKGFEASYLNVIIDTRVDTKVE